MATAHNSQDGYFDGMKFHPHKKFRVGCVDIVAPAKLDYSKSRLWQLETEAGIKVYALPGGGEITENGRVISWGKRYAA